MNSSNVYFMRRTNAAWVCCPTCDMDREHPKGKCPGHDKCEEITRYLMNAEKRSDKPVD